MPPVLELMEERLNTKIKALEEECSFAKDAVARFTQDVQSKAQLMRAHRDIDAYKEIGNMLDRSAQQLSKLGFEVLSWCGEQDASEPNFVPAIEYPSSPPTPLQNPLESGNEEHTHAIPLGIESTHIKEIAPSPKISTRDPPQDKGDHLASLTDQLQKTMKARGHTDNLNSKPTVGVYDEFDIPAVTSENNHNPVLPAVKNHQVENDVNPPSKGLQCPVGSMRSRSSSTSLPFHSTENVLRGAAEALRNHPEVAKVKEEEVEAATSDEVVTEADKLKSSESLDSTKHKSISDQFDTPPESVNMGLEGGDVQTELNRGEELPKNNIDVNTVNNIPLQPNPANAEPKAKDSGTSQSTMSSVIEITPSAPQPQSSEETSTTSRHPASFGFRETSDGMVPKKLHKFRVPPLWKYCQVVYTVDDVEGVFYLQLKDDATVITDIYDEVQDVESTGEHLTMDCIDPGTIICAPYEDDYFRARILSMTSEDEIDVRFIDYGNTEKVSLSSLRGLPAKGSKSTRFCQLAIRCRFTPSLDNETGRELLHSGNTKGEEAFYACLSTLDTTASKSTVNVEDETVYMVMDVVKATPVNFVQMPFDDYIQKWRDMGEKVVSTLQMEMSYAVNPQQVYMVSTQDLLLRDDIEKSLQQLPLMGCNQSSAKEGYYVSYQHKRARIVGANEGLVDLFLVDYGSTQCNIAIQDCSCISVHAMIRAPALAKKVVMAKCLPTDSGWLANISNLMTIHCTGKKYCIRLLNSENVHETFIVDAITRKNLGAEIKKMGWCK